MNKFSRILNRILLPVLIAVFCVSGFLVVRELHTGHQEEQAFRELDALLEAPEPTRATAGETAPSDAPDASEPTLPAEEGGILPRYRAVYEKNSDLYGWVELEGTKLSYPVVCTPEDEEYYLRRDFSGNYARSGVPFLDVRCTPEGRHQMVYGHNMKNGTMFSLLEEYESESFWREHPEIRFDTIYEEGRYQVAAAFFTRAYGKEETGIFRWHDYADLSDPEDFAAYLAWAQANALYDTGVDVTPDDELLTLVTCSYGAENDRFVVIARRCQ